MVLLSDEVTLASLAKGSAVPGRGGILREPPISNNDLVVCVCVCVGVPGCAYDRSQYLIV